MVEIYSMTKLDSSDFYFGRCNNGKYKYHLFDNNIDCYLKNNDNHLPLLEGRPFSIGMSVSFPFEGWKQSDTTTPLVNFDKDGNVIRLCHVPLEFGNDLRKCKTYDEIIDVLNTFCESKGYKITA